jgi:O-acetyl-ADP-ribose deacetylase (regulator of RNase III)
MNDIQYLNGDASYPSAFADENIVLAHVCNDVGGWGRGFVLSISKRWKEPERQYRAWYNGNHQVNKFRLGSVQFVEVERGWYVANMIAQHGLNTSGSQPPIRYDALRECLREVQHKAQAIGASVHMPKIGCGLAGGDWGVVETIIRDELLSRGIKVVVYLLPGKNKRPSAVQS